MKSSLMLLAPVFTSNRMVVEYTEDFYIKAHRRHAVLMADGLRRARSLAEWKRRIRDAWPRVTIRDVQASPSDLKVGDSVEIKAVVGLGGLDPSEIAIQVHCGPMDLHDSIVDGTTIDMTQLGSTGDGGILCSTSVPLRTSGRQGFTVRVVPRHDDLEDPIDVPLVVWG